MFKWHKILILQKNHKHKHTHRNNSVGTEPCSITCTKQVGFSFESENCYGILVSGDPVMLSEWCSFLLPHWDFWECCTYLSVVWAMWSQPIKSSLPKVKRYMEKRPRSFLTEVFNQKVNSNTSLIQLGKKECLGVRFPNNSFHWIKPHFK